MYFYYIDNLTIDIHVDFILNILLYLLSMSNVLFKFVDTHNGSSSSSCPDFIISQAVRVTCSLSTAL